MKVSDLYQAKVIFHINSTNHKSQKTNMKLIPILPNRLENRPRQQIKVRSSFRFLSIASLLFSGICLGTTDAAFANIGDHCKNVEIRIINRHPVAISVIKVEYYKDGLVATDMLEAINRRTIEPIHMLNKVENLKFVRDKLTFLKATYIKGIAANGSAILHSYRTPEFVCKNGSIQILDLK
jgi:hypothetical protein